MDLELQRSLVESALEVPLMKGATWCVLSRKWYDAFRHFVGLHGATQSGAHPGRMFCGELLAGKELKEGLQEGEDYVVVPRGVFELLHGWYQGSDAITRVVIEEGEGSKAMLRVEVYLLKLRIVLCDGKGVLQKAHVAQYSKKERVHEVLAKQCARLGLDPSLTRVFTMDGEGDEILEETLLPPATVLEDALLAPMQRLCLQAKGATDKEWPPLPSDRLTKKANSATGGNTANAAGGNGGGSFFRRLFGKKESKDPSRSASTEAEAPIELNVPVAPAVVSRPELDNASVSVSESGGMCGLNNLGNTCFMNGAVQALLHADPLVRYFLAGHYKKELNKKNPLGMKGELAVALGDLVKEVWRSSGITAVAPKQLKHVIGRFAPQFQGYQQHDAHELLAFLLDGVHEDLNRVLQKPFVDLDADQLAADLDDKQRAQIFWNKHEQRNQSIIVDLFHAQLRSTINCPPANAGGCGRQSVTYDAFAYLSLPLPSLSSEKRFVEAAVVRDPALEYGAWFSEMPIKYSVEVTATDAIMDIVASLVSVCGEDPAQKHAIGSLSSGVNNLIMTEQLNHKVFKSYQAAQSASIVSSRDLLFGFSLPRGNNDLLYTYISFSHAKPYGAARDRYGSSESFGLPFMAAFLIDVPQPVLRIYQTCWRAVSCYVRDALWTTVGEPVFLAGESLSNEEILAVKSQLLAKGPPEGSVPAEGCWRVDHRQWEGQDDKTGKTVVRYQVLMNKKLLSEFPFKLRWSCDSFNSTCIRCGQRMCEGCDLAKTADEPGAQPEEHIVNFLALRGRLALVLFWEDETTRNETLDMAASLNVRLHASVKANRAVAANGGRKDGMTLQDCLSHFQLNEKLDHNNTWYCNVCKAHKEAWKMMQIHSLPTVLVIQLKRFKTTGHYRQKLNYPVVFPLSGLDMTPFVLAPREGGWVYDCFAVVNHSGDLGGGHYTAYAKHNVTGKWNLYDDGRVSPVTNESSITGSAAYILFYVRREAPPSAPPPTDAKL